jgi:hypothetical protein
MLLKSVSVILASLVCPIKQVNPAFNSIQLLKHEHNISPNVLSYGNFIDLRGHYHYLQIRARRQQISPKNFKQCTELQSVR